MSRLASGLCLLILSPFVLPGGSAAASDPASDDRPAELTEIARQFPRHEGTTILHVNFGGWKDYDGKGHDILPYRPRAGDRDRSIQMILFRAAEKYAPFDVEIHRLRGAGKFDDRDRGNTTVFVGADTLNSAPKKGKFTYARTPGTFVDAPGAVRGPDHQPNSDPYDLAFVDPVAGQEDRTTWATTWDEDRIARALVHEAGHTFGLAHTDTDKITDVMSYDAANVFFANRPFAITDRNNNGTEVIHTTRFLPRWGDRPIVSQNSFTYLKAVLGEREKDDYANVADPSAVDPAFADGRLVELHRGKKRRGIIDRRGDYDVFLLRAAASEKLTILARPDSEGVLTPVLFVFDGPGRNLLAFANGRTNDASLAQVALAVEKGRTYKVVVGAADCASVGSYEVAVRAAAGQPGAGRKPKGR